MALGPALGNYLLKLGVEPFNFSKKNTITQAIWTYVIWAFAAFIAAWILMMIILKVAPGITALVVKIYSLVVVGIVGWKMLQANNATNNTMAIAKVGLAVVLSFFFVYYTGLIILALFTTEKFHLLKDPKDMDPTGGTATEEQNQQQQ